MCGWGSRRGSGWERRLALAQPKSPLPGQSLWLHITGVQNSEPATARIPIVTLFLPEEMSNSSQDPFPGSSDRVVVQTGLSISGRALCLWLHTLWRVVVSQWVPL